MNEENIFDQLLKDEQKHEAIEQKEQWKVLIVDDEKAIHAVIRLALDDFIFKNKEIQFFVANSAFEAKDILKQNPDIALILLDVVMESNTAGLELVKFIRKELENHFIQIVLWTGQPGQAPKREVIFSYEINDYKTKIELNDDNIFTVVLASLRTYDAIITLESFRQSLEQKVIERTKEVVTQKEKITNSIQYARNIQNAILPSEKAICKITMDYFIFFRPRDIVSGDFYWFSEQNGKLFLAAVDCTGHGVPGAFMSMIGNTLLNEIVNEKKIYTPSKILEKLNASIIYALSQDEKQEHSSDDGMNISLCCIDKTLNEIQISSAIQDVIIINNNEIKTIHGDIYSIGGVLSIKQDAHFTDHIEKIKKGTTIYLFSDGFQDQFNWESKKKFTLKRLKDLLFENRHLKMQEQYKKLVAAFENWKGDFKQVDDVLVMGIKI
ncbi:MAG: SpoIIE family protein phosphatase [Bacteroidales bacterium]|nr:SpoIIE family protein phosphatase [Bacteroidales bacterium]